MRQCQFQNLVLFRPHRTLEYNKILTSRPPVALTEHLLWKRRQCEQTELFITQQLILRDAKFFFPRQFRTPSTNSFAYSQSELHDMNSHDLRLRNKSTHARGLFIAVRKRGKNTRKQDAYNQIYVQKWHTNIVVYCALIRFTAWSWTITLVRGKLTLLEIKDRPYRHQNNYGLISKDFYTHTACTVGVDL